MKKIALFTALLSLGIAVNAQTLNVQSAMSDLKRGYLNKAKSAIDKACVHPDTKDDAKTWYYAGLIYSQIGDQSKNPKSKYKDLDSDWCNKTYNAALRCKELDTKGEYSVRDIFRYVGQEFYNQSIDVFNSGDYQGALKLADEAIKVFNNSGDAEYANESYYIAGYSCQLLNDNDGVKKYYGPLVRKNKISEDFKPKMVRVYNTMYGIYKEANDTVNVIRTAERYTKVMPEDANAHLLLASAYVWTGNFSKGIELANKAVEESKNTSNYPILLCGAAGIYEQAGDFASAEAKYKESADIQPNQIEANYGMGIMIYNRAVDKVQAINKMIESGNLSEEDEVLINKLAEESNGFFEQAIPYLKAAVNYIDGLNEEEQAMKRPNLYNCLRTLNTCYVRLDMLNEAKPIKVRLDQLEKGN